MIFAVFPEVPDCSMVCSVAVEQSLGKALAEPNLAASVQS